ncbi:MAG: hypothetical protein GX790_06470 [Syntrophomonadaceae bacterium]|nr:hypothetical protein [Syntrophomonadaceae bacterium]
MKANKFKMFYKLYEKEMRELKIEIWLTVLAIIGATILTYVGGADQRWTILPLFLTAGLAALLPVVTASKIFIKEFNHNTIYLMMSLPVGGGMILGSKLAATVTQYLIGTIFFMISAAMLTLCLFPVEKDTLIKAMGSVPWGLFISIYFSTVAFGIYLVVITFFSQIISRLVTKFQNLVTVIALAGTLWLTFKLIDPLILEKDYYVGNMFMAADLFVYASLFFIGVAFVIGVVTVLIYNRRIEL